MLRPTTPFNSVRFASIRRLASTSNSPISNNDNPFQHKEWPKKSNPTPYEILNVNKSFHMKDLRSKYYQMAKIYHPDISSKSHHVDHSGKHLTDAHKLERFKLLTDAYNLLKDSKKRALYDQYRIGWKMSDSFLDDAFKSQRQTSYTSSRAHKANYADQAYWNASTWEDYENLRRNHKPLSREEKYQVLAGILFVVVASASIQGWFIFESVEQSLLEKQRIHDSCENDLSLAYMNYGLDGSRLSRMRRFLWFRTFGMYVDKESLDRGAEENERLLNEIMGITETQ